MDSTLSTYIAPPVITDPTAGVKNGDKIKKAAQDFEAMFVTEMLRPIFDREEIDSTFSGGSSEKIYRSMMLDEYGKSIAKAGGIGIAKNVQAEMIKLQELQSKNSMETKNVASR